MSAERPWAVLVITIGVALVAPLIDPVELGFQARDSIVGVPELSKQKMS